MCITLLPHLFFKGTGETNQFNVVNVFPFLLQQFVVIYGILGFRMFQTVWVGEKFRIQTGQISIQTLGSHASVIKHAGKNCFWTPSWQQAGWSHSSLSWKMQQTCFPNRFSVFYFNWVHLQWAQVQTEMNLVNLQFRVSVVICGCSDEMFLKTMIIGNVWKITSNLIILVFCPVSLLLIVET